jgi:hypothetical protein
MTAAGGLTVNFWNGIESLNFAKALNCATTRGGIPNINWTTLATGPALEESNLKLIPLLNKESIHAVFRSKHEWSRNDFQDCCSAADTPILRVCNVTESLCNEERTPCWPWLPYCLTCALRPYIKYERILVSDTSVMQFTVAENFGCCGFNASEECKCSTGPCKSGNGDFLLTWASLNDLVGHNSAIKSIGHETWFRRCLKNTRMGKICFPMSK